MTNRSNHKGFTIVELLIVIVIIGILAAIVIVAYNGITNRATNAAVKNDLTNMAKKLELYKVDNGKYPINDAQLEAADVHISRDNYLLLDSSGNPRNNLYYRVDTNGRWYALDVISKAGEKSYLKNGQIEATSDSSWAATGEEVVAMAAAAGVTITTSDLGGSTGYSGTAGWAAWTE